MWLEDCLERAASHTTTPDRALGAWLQEQHEAAGHPWPDDDDDGDERFAPICVAMFLESISPLRKQFGNR